MVDHKVHVNKEYHSVCPLVGIGTLPVPTPLSPASVAPPPGTKGEGAHSPAGEGLGESRFRRLEKSLALVCLLCGVDVRVLVNRDETLLLADQPVITEKEVLDTIERKVPMSSLIFLDLLLREDGFIRGKFVVDMLYYIFYRIFFFKFRYHTIMSTVILQHRCI
jgi:hypothetical protein